MRYLILPLLATLLWLPHLSLSAADAVGLQAQLTADPMDNRTLVLTLSNTGTKPLALDSKELPHPEFVPPSTRTAKPSKTPAPMGQLVPGQWKLLEPGKKLKVRIRLSDEISQEIAALAPNTGIQVCLNYTRLLVGEGNPPKPCPSPTITSNAVLYQLKGRRLDVTELN